MPREDYDERRSARIDRLRDRAGSATGEAKAAHDQASRMADAIPLGQPILVGHHSERRDRNYRKRISKTFEKAALLQTKAKRLDERADAAERNRAISSDDPHGVEKLRGKLADLERCQRQMKQLNAAWRATKRPSPDDVEGWRRVAAKLGVEFETLAELRFDVAKRMGWSGDATPYPGYALTNQNAEMRRVRVRIAELERAVTAESSAVDHGFVSVVENAELNRVQLIFPGKPDKPVREMLQSRGFRWARSVGAWQRHLNDAGRHAAKRLVEYLSQQPSE